MKWKQKNQAGGYRNRLWLMVDLERYDDQREGDFQGLSWLPSAVVEPLTGKERERESERDGKFRGFSKNKMGGRAAAIRY